jgi:hypothetical protein
MAEKARLWVLCLGEAVSLVIGGEWWIEMDGGAFEGELGCLAAGKWRWKRKGHGC